MNTVVLLDPRLGPVLPAAALAVLRTADEVYVGGDLPFSLGLPPAPAAFPAHRSVVVVAADLSGNAAARLFAAGAAVIGTPAPPGAELLAAVAVMDRLRSPGGCPWDAEQTHDSLRRYLVEETYELLEAIEDGDRAALREWRSDAQRRETGPDRVLRRTYLYWPNNAGATQAGHRARCHSHRRAEQCHNFQHS